MDNWVGCGPLQDFCSVIGDISLSVAEVIDVRGPKNEIISGLVPSKIVQQINEAGVRLKSNKLDVLIWKHSVEANFTTRNWKGMMMYWWQRASIITQVGWIMGVLPILISWALWEARCSSRMEGIIFNIEGAVRYVKCLLKEASCLLQNFQKIRKGDNVVMQNFRLLIIPTHKKKVKFVKWEMPHSDMIKLNVDGGACTNLREAGGGGVIQDSNGSCIAGFAHCYGYATNTVAECRALLDGLRLCKQLRFQIQSVLVESDSLVVMNWLASGICHLWFLGIFGRR
ncbi:uncharacterized protein LOC122281287 [Carya illinoinensis]|uniref:uncharacterized protein LOC122281287 n=1 Tax=Carya illinoinensis TaxID=32201 RepID=UPI001C71A99A|nr:uncharacterized protein LOC122281287 [Carya illinoinensis]